jgi:hypothetical protein
MGAEPGDTGHQGNAATPVLLGEGSREEAPAALVGGSKEPVDGTVHLSGRGAEGKGRRRLSARTHEPRHKPYLASRLPYPTLPHVQF